jgi:hypothetical protein
MPRYQPGDCLQVDLSRLHHPLRRIRRDQPEWWSPAEIIAVTTWPTTAAGAPRPTTQTLYRVRLLDGPLHGITATTTAAALSTTRGTPVALAGGE